MCFKIQLHVYPWINGSTYLSVDCDSMTRRKHRKIKFRSVGIILCRVQINSNIIIIFTQWTCTLYNCIAIQYTVAIGFTRAQKRRYTITLFCTFIHALIYRHLNEHKYMDKHVHIHTRAHTICVPAEHNSVIVCITRRHAHTNIRSIASAIHSKQNDTHKRKRTQIYV